jgi:hypothetical protein
MAKFYIASSEEISAILAYANSRYALAAWRFDCRKGCQQATLFVAGRWIEMSGPRIAPGRTNRTTLRDGWWHGGSST